MVIVNRIALFLRTIKKLDSLLLGYSLIISIICVNVVRLAHNFHRNMIIWAYRVLLILPFIIIPTLYKYLSYLALIGLLLGLALSLNIADSEAKELAQEEKQKRKISVQAAEKDMKVC